MHKINYIIISNNIPNYHLFQFFYSYLLLEQIVVNFDINI